MLWPVLSWDNTLERECRLALWKHGAPWKHGSVKDGKVERPFYLGEEHTELTLCLSWLRVNTHRAKTSNVKHGWYEGMFERTLTKLINYPSSHRVHHTRAAFGLLGNKGMHSYNGNIWLKAVRAAVEGKTGHQPIGKPMELVEDALQACYQLYKVKEPDLRLFQKAVRSAVIRYLGDTGANLYAPQFNNPIWDRENYLLGKTLFDIWKETVHHGNMEPSIVNETAFLQHWEEVITAFSHKDINVLLTQNHQLKEALVFDTLNTLTYKGLSCNWGNIKGMVIELLTNTNQGTKLGLLRDPSILGQTWNTKVITLGKILAAEWSNKPLDQQKEFTNSYLHKQIVWSNIQPPLKLKSLQTYKVASSLAIGNPAIKKCHATKQTDRHQEIADWMNWANSKPHTNYKWWLRALPHTPVGEIALGPHRTVKLLSIIHSKEIMPTPLLSLSPVERIKETLLRVTSNKRHGHKSKKNKLITKPKPNHSPKWRLVITQSPGLLDAADVSREASTGSRILASTSGV